MLTYISVALLVIVAAAMVVWRAQVIKFSQDTVVFVGEVKSEIQKVTWPDREQLRKMTLVILGFCFVVAVIIGLLDVVLQWLLVTLPGRA